MSAARMVKEFNERHLVGTKVRYWKGVRAGEPTDETATVGPASLLGGHTAVIWLDGVSGCIALTHVEAVR